MIAAGTLSELYENALRLFKANGFAEPDAEVRGVLSVGLGVTTSEVYSLFSEPLSEEDRDRCLDVLTRRLKHEPLAYIEGRKGFFGQEYSVNRHVLIPRPETELLIETALREINRMGRPHPVIADIGTGSGCIALSLARAVVDARVIAVDVSIEALSAARANAKRQNLESRIEWAHGDLFDGLPEEKTGPFDIIVSNPPYVATSEFSQLDPDLAFEPRLALDGGEDGLRVIAPLTREAANRLRPGGVLLMEIGTGQADAVRELLLKSGFSLIRIEKDYGGHDRIAKGVLSGSI